MNEKQLRDEARERVSNSFYILNGKMSVRERDIYKWGEWMEQANRIVKQTAIQDVYISTVFLGLDHGIYEDKPILFETMIFGGEHDIKLWRYSTWEEAEAGHQRACELVCGIETDK